MEIDTGDTVLHTPTGEEWVVACVINDRLSWAGWPEGTAALKDCVLVTKATTNQRDNLLKVMAECKEQDDHRVRYARGRLSNTDEGTQ